MPIIVPMIFLQRLTGTRRSRMLHFHLCRRLPAACPGSFMLVGRVVASRGNNGWAKCRLQSGEVLATC